MNERQPSTNWDEEPIWARTVGIAVRRWRGVLAGVGVSWAALLLAYVLLPPRIECQATLSLPTDPQVERPREGEPQQAAEGVTVSAYKRVEAALADRQLLSLALKGLSERELISIGATMKEHLSPLTTGSRNEVERATKDDRVTAVRFSYDASSPERARLVVDALARLVGSVLVTDVARAWIETQLTKRQAAVANAAVRKADLAYANKSLELLEADLARLGGGGGAAEGGSRQVVDVREKGYQYLPPSLQLVGVKAKRADNAHDMRLAAQEVATAAVRIALYTRLQGALQREFDKNNAFVVFEPASVLQREFEQFLRERPTADTEDLRLEFATFTDGLLQRQSNTSFIARPTVRQKSRAPLFAAVALVVAALIVAAVVAGETWRRFESRSKAVA